MTPDQYRREGAEAMREAAAEHCWAKRDILADAEKRQIDVGLSGRDYYGRRLEAELLSKSIRAIDVDDVLAGATETPRAWRDVMGERVRQITVEGWTPEHDDCHDRAELAQAAACYAISGTPADEAVFIHGRWKYPRDLFWPRGFGLEWWKPTNRRRDLVKAGALILAEIERLDRDACKEARDD